MISFSLFHLLFLSTYLFAIFFYGSQREGYYPDDIECVRDLKPIELVWLSNQFVLIHGRSVQEAHDAWSLRLEKNNYLPCDHLGILYSDRYLIH